jgi:hypothetical protein
MSSCYDDAGSYTTQSIDKVLGFNDPGTWETELFLQDRHHVGRGPSYLQIGYISFTLSCCSVAPLLQQSHTAGYPHAIRPLRAMHAAQLSHVGRATLDITLGHAWRLMGSLSNIHM